MGRPPLKKAAIERSALELFVEKGVDGTSIRDIAERAGVTEGALYRHHRSKDDLVRALFFRSHEDFAGLIANIDGSPAPYQDLLPKLVRAFFCLYDQDPYSFQLVMLVRHKLLDEVRVGDKNPVELLDRLVNRAVDRSEIRAANPALLTQLTLGIILQCAAAHRDGRLTGSLEDYTDEVARACLAVATLEAGSPSIVRTGTG